jgi:archaellum component FlaF (FlaF/FlaG flagellin family)|tara:strand:+ start:1406 stop:1585 length:180 start_codon:yes stop_codon:yes gene_type:complete
MLLDFVPGDYVINQSNKEWGIGQIQSIVKNKVTVNFENNGKQVLNLEVVSLEKVINEQK